MNSNHRNSDVLKSVDELVTSLIEGERTNYAEMFSSINLPIDALEKYSSWSDLVYTRNCIVENENFELILICWEKGQMTPIHDHGGQECWVNILKGELKETIYKVDEEGELNAIKSIISCPGDVSYMIDFMGCHKLENATDDRCMSLHLYAKPIRNCRLFDEDSKTFTRKNLVYDTVFNIEPKLKQ